jgi:hypothetical protein
MAEDKETRRLGDKEISLSAGKFQCLFVTLSDPVPLFSYVSWREITIVQPKCAGVE